MTWLRWALFLDRFEEFHLAVKDIGYERIEISRKKLLMLNNTWIPYLNRCSKYTIIDHNPLNQDENIHNQDD